MDRDILFKKWGIAITGGIASGKTYVSNCLREKGFLVYDADEISREVSQKGSSCYEEICKNFGSDLLTPTGEINRRELAKIVFSSSEKRVLLESIVHPAIQEKLVEKLKVDGFFEKPRYWFYEAALIFEKEKENIFFQTWLVFCSKKTQISRLKTRNPELTEDSIQKILDSQMSFEQKKKRASFLIDTDMPKEKVKKILDSWFDLKV